MSVSRGALVNAPSNNRLQRTALCAAAEPERWVLLMRT